MEKTNALAWTNDTMIAHALAALACALEAVSKKGTLIVMGQRANGEGSVYRRSDRKHGQWVASIILDNGQRKSVYCETKAEATKELRRLNQEKEQGLQVATTETLGHFLISWLDDSMQMNLRARTYIRYRELIERHIIPELGNIKLQQLTPLHLQKLYNDRRRAGLAPGTVKNIHLLLHNALSDALKWGLIIRNVCDAVDTPRVPRQEMTVLTVEQVQEFLDGAIGDPLEALYVLALTTGMREGELLGLKWDDLDLAQGRLQVRRSVARVRGQGFVFSEPKTPKSRRLVYLTERAVEALMLHQLRQSEKKLAMGAVWEEHGLVFCNGIGRPLEVASLVMRSFRPLLKKAGLPQIRFHDLRHTVATMLLSMDVHPKVVQELFGHSQISITLDTYSHVLPSMQQNAVHCLNTLLRPKQA